MKFVDDCISANAQKAFYKYNDFIKFYKTKLKGGLGERTGAIQTR